MSFMASTLVCASRANILAGTSTNLDGGKAFAQQFNKIENHLEQQYLLQQFFTAKKYLPGTGRMNSAPQPKDDDRKRTG